MVAATYNQAITKVFSDEGGYGNDPRDPGGATNWGITIADARMYWKANATPNDVRAMPKSVAADIYKTKYAAKVGYDLLPAGYDYAVLDYGINSGLGRAIPLAAATVGEAGSKNLAVIAAAANASPDKIKIIKYYYSKRVAFLRGLSIFRTFGVGWMRRCTSGEALAVKLWMQWGLKADPVVTKTVLVDEASTAKKDAKVFGS